MEDLRYVQEPPQLPGIRDRTKELKFPMASEPLVGALLRTLAAGKPAGRLLELGTGTGMATAWLLAGMDRASTLVSVDIDEKVQAVAKQALGSDPRLTLILQDGTDFLRQQPPRSFDLVFADAMPGKYEALEPALELVKPAGFFVIDDMLPQPSWPEGHGERADALMQRLFAEADFAAAPLVWASGVVLAVRKPSRT